MGLDRHQTRPTCPARLKQDVERTDCVCFSRHIILHHHHNGFGCFYLLLKRGAWKGKGRGKGKG